MASIYTFGNMTLNLFRSGKNLEKNRSSSNRQSRLCQEVQRFVSQLVIKQSLPPVTIDGQMVMVDPMMSIVRADVSPDMKTAKIYVRHFDQDRLPSVLGYLDAVKNTIRHTMAKELNMRYTPALSFHADCMAEQERRMDELFHKIRSS